MAKVNEGLLLTAPHVNAAMLSSRLDQVRPSFHTNIELP